MVYPVVEPRSPISTTPSSENARTLAGRGALRSVRGRLFLLTIVLVLTSALVAVVLLVDSARRHRESTERQLAGTARALSLAVDGEIGKAQVLLRALSGSDELNIGDWETFDREARAAVRDEATWIVVVDEAGRQQVNTSIPRGAPLPSAPDPAFPARWAQLLAHGSSVSGLSRGRVYDGRILVIDLLAVTPSGRRYDVAMVMRPEVVGRLVARQDLPAGWYGGVLDGQGYLITRNIDPEGTLGRRATATTLQHVLRRSSGVFESVSLDGAQTLAAFQRSELTGWTVAVAMPRAEAAGYLNRSLIQFLAAGVGLIVLGLALSLWLVQGVNRAVLQVVGAAEVLGDGVPKPMPATGLWETDRIAAALHEADVRLNAREAELTSLNETLEARVEEQAAKLVQGQKLEAIGRMTGGVAHDFNNLLTAVIGNLDLLKRRLTDPAHERFVTNAREAAERGARLTSQLLAFSRRQRLAPEPTDVNGIVRGMGDLLISTLGGSVRVETSLTDHLPQAMADRTQLELVILNLALNSRDASPTDGVIRLITSQQEVIAPAKQPEQPEPGRYVTLTVADTGEGMEPQTLARVFEPFFTTKAPGRGSGLGLSQALGVLKQLGGGLEIRSTVGQGTAITLFLPLAPAQAAAPRPEREAPAPVAVGCQVLLVDDYGPLRTAARTLLEDLGCVVHDAESGEAALKLVQAGLDVPIAFVDYAMPGMTGIDLAAELARLRPELTVILSSGYLEADDDVRAWTGPLLPKPYAAEELARALSRYAPPPREDARA